MIAEESCKQCSVYTYIHSVGVRSEREGRNREREREIERDKAIEITSKLNSVLI